MANIAPDNTQVSSSYDSSDIGQSGVDTSGGIKLNAPEPQAVGQEEQPSQTPLHITINKARIPTGFEPVPPQDMPQQQASNGNTNVPPGFEAVPPEEQGSQRIDPVTNEPYPPSLDSALTSDGASLVKGIVGSPLELMKGIMTGTIKPGTDEGKDAARQLALIATGLTTGDFHGLGPQFKPTADPFADADAAAGDTAVAKNEGPGASDVMGAANNQQPQQTPQLSKARLSADKLQKDLFQSGNIDPNKIADILEAQRKQTGLPLMAADAIQLDDLGEPVTGNNVLKMVSAAAQKPGEAQNLAENMLERQKFQKQQFKSILEDILSSDSPYQLHQQALQELGTEGKAAQDAAFNQNGSPVWSDRLQQFLEDPDVQSGIQKGFKVQRDFALARGEPFDPKEYGVTSYNEAGDPIISGTPNMKALDAGRKGMQDMLENDSKFVNPTTGQPTQAAAGLMAKKAAYTNELKALNPAYGNYLDVAGDPMERLAAAKMGRGFTGMRPEEIDNFLNGNADKFNAGQDAKLVEPPSEGAKASFKAAAMEDMADKMSLSKDDSYVLDKIWKESTRDRLEPMLSDENMSELNNHVNMQRAMMRTNRALGGSNTFDKFMANQEIEDSVGQHPVEHAATAMRFAAHPVRATLDFGANMAEDFANKRTSNMSNDAAAELMKDYTSTDPEYWRTMAQRLGYK